MNAQPTTVLDRILAETRDALADRKRERPIEDSLLDERAMDRRAGVLRAALSGEGIGVIAEFKRRSPSAGTLGQDPVLEEVVGAYERGGAVAVSILTEGSNFGGSLDDLRAARAACSLALLRKDFVVDPYQLHEALLAGADAVLLIVAALRTRELADLQARAEELKLDALVEVHDRRELHAALELGATIIGINNRDLRDFSVEISRTESLLEEIPRGPLVVSESGIRDAGQVRRLAERGVSAVLVGEALMRAPDTSAALRALLAQAPPGPSRAAAERL